MGKSLSRLNLAVATVFAASLGWLAVAGLSNGTLGGLLTLHRTGPGEIPLAPRANPAVPAVASEMPPLMGTALWNSPAASGEAINAQVLMAPADCPITVMRSGSPP